MDRTSSVRWLVGLSVLAVATALSAASPPELIKLSSRVLQEQSVIGADGRAQLLRVPAQRILPGSELIYEVSYANVGNRSAAELFITNPLPSELSYRTSLPSGASTRFEVSVDRGRSFGDLAVLRVFGADGKLRPAQASDITHVRWHVKRPVKPGDAGKVALKAVLR